jgi:hypothetical protein
MAYLAGPIPFVLLQEHTRVSLAELMFLVLFLKRTNSQPRRAIGFYKTSFLRIKQRSFTVFEKKNITQGFKCSTERVCLHGIEQQVLTMYV